MVSGDAQFRIGQDKIHNVEIPKSMKINSRVPIMAWSLWSGTNKNRDVSTGPLARPFARSLAPLTHSLAPDYSLRSRPPLRSLIRSLRSLCSLPRSWESEFLMSQNDLVLSHGAATSRKERSSIDDAYTSCRPYLRRPQ